MNVMITGTDARAHAMGWKIGMEAREPGAESVENIYFAPGNGGTEDVGENVPLNPTDAEGVAEAVKFAQQNGVDLTVVSPEAHIAAGLGNAFREAGLAIICPTAEAGMIETSKGFAKGIMDQRGVPTAGYGVFTDPEEALAYARDNPGPKFVKVDGLAEGKGSQEALTPEDVERIIVENMVEGRFGQAGRRVVIEEHLGGPEAPEVSLIALVSRGKRRLFPLAQDHKHAGPGHTGPMTGGMGVVSPLPGLGDSHAERWAQQTMDPVTDELARRGTPYEGFLFGGLKLKRKESGLIVPHDELWEPKVLEFNAREGSPEAEVHMRLMASSLLRLLIACHEGTLGTADLRFKNLAAATIIMASEGYPGKYPKGLTIEGLEDAKRMEDVEVFHAGTVREGRQTKTNGGRVVSVTATGPTLQAALDRAHYVTDNVIHWPGAWKREDVGRGAVNGIFAA